MMDECSKNIPNVSDCDVILERERKRKLSFDRRNKMINTISLSSSGKSDTSSSSEKPHKDSPPKTAENARVMWDNA